MKTEAIAEREERIRTICDTHQCNDCPFAEMMECLAYKKKEERK